MTTINGGLTAISASPLRTLLVLGLAVVVLSYPVRFLIVKIYFLQDFASMTPQERIERFSWKMHVWRYRFSPSISPNQLDDYIKQTFTALYPPGNSIEPLVATLKKESRCYDISNQGASHVLAPTETRSRLRFVKCSYGFISTFLGIVPYGLAEWHVFIAYDEKTKQVVTYSARAHLTGL